MDKKKNIDDIRNSISCMDAINAIFWCGGKYIHSLCLERVP